MTHDNDNAPTSSTAAPDLDPASETALDWFMRRQAGAMPADALQAFEAWHRADPAHARAYARVAKFWDSPELSHALAPSAQESADRPPAADTGGDAPANTPGTGRPAGRLRAALALAAMLVLAIGLGQAAGVTPFTPFADYATTTGERAEIALPDGSRLVLNAESAVNLAFAPGRRRLELIRGEAFFEVTPDARRPFEVAAGRSVTRVLGTAFTVALRGERTEVRVERGHVQVAGDDGRLPVDLTPGQGVTVTAGRAGAVTLLEPATAFAWRDGRFVFRDRPLADVMARLARHHRGKIVLTDERLRDLKVSGNYRLDDPAAVVSSLADVAGAEIIRLPGLLTILH